MDTKYLPLGVCETVADFIVPTNRLCTFAFIHLSLGSLILLFLIEFIANIIKIERKKLIEVEIK